MGALAHYIEQEGIPTTQISLIRDHTERIRPPRALWVPFELGRPLGEPGDAGFQTRVLRAALQLVTRSDAPVLLDFPDDAPGARRPEDEAGWSCPLPLPPREEPTDLAEAFRRELAGLLTWYALSLERRGRTTVGLAGLEPKDLGDFLSAFAGEGLPESPSEDVPLAVAFKHATADLKALYGEAALAKPASPRPNGAELGRWFWNDTHAGAFLQALSRQLGQGDDPSLQLIARAMLVPVAQRG